MPWHTLGAPSIQLGCLEAALRDAAIECRSHSFHLELQRFLAVEAALHEFTLADYEQVAVGWENLGVGEWLFAVPPFRAEHPEPERRYAELLERNGVSRRALARLRRVRALVPRFVARCADEVLAARPSVVGFTIVYSQLWPSAALARALKARDPALRIVFGGASCEGPMGPAILKAFPQVDVIVRGEAEGVLAPLMRALSRGAEPPGLPGLCWRAGDGLVEVPRAHGTTVDLDTLAPPVYDEYFERLARSGLAHHILPQVPFESSRGCWWGAKQHCTFCGLNGLDMAFRRKSPERVEAELDALSARHEALDFTAVDNILDLGYFETLLPRLAASGRDRSFFYETKANLTREQVHTLRAAGVRTIQPGIESLSTSVLALMRKGVSGFQNLRLLAWCAARGIHVIWNLLYGFPGEDPAEYARMAALAPSLAHLTPPELVRLMVYRFSPYHDDPARHGLVLTGPLPYVRHLYDVDDSTRADLAQAFDYVHADGRDPEAYVGELREEVARWRRDAARNRGALTYRRGPGFLVVTDTRTTTTPTPVRYTLGPAEARVYLACADGVTRRGLAGLRDDDGEPVLDEGALDGLLRDLAAARLVAELDGKLLALAQPRFGAE
jgi:ribosomal peptide maturation radical SAM protein 1